MLLVIENVLTAKEVQEFKDILQKAPWHDGQTTAGSVAKQVKKNEQADDNNESVIQLGNHIIRRLSNHPLFISAALPNKIYPPKFNRYKNNGCYGAHVDSAVMNVNNQSIRSDLSATLFLNDPEQYEGGTLEIETQYGSQSVKLKAGDMVLYPSTSLHQVTPVTSGERLCSFFWIQSMVKSTSDREILFDLDQSIQTLTAESKNPQALTKLTGIYHNLLRKWANV